MNNYYPYNNRRIYRNYPVQYTNNNDDRFLFPFLVGGVAGTALGYGIANNNYNSNNRPPVYYYPYYYQPYQGPMVPYYYWR